MCNTDCTELTHQNSAWRGSKLLPQRLCLCTRLVCCRARVLRLRQLLPQRLGLYARLVCCRAGVLGMRQLLPQRLGLVAQLRYARCLGAAVNFVQK